MRAYECPECGSVKIAKDWAYCSYPCDDVGMYEVVDWDKDSKPTNLDAMILAYKNKAKN